MLRPLLSISLALVLLATFSTAHADAPTSHTVAWGETLYSIARTYGITPQAIASANGINPNGWLYAGQQIKIPVNSPPAAASTSPAGYYAVHAGDTLASIAARFGVSAAAVAAANNLPGDGMLYVGWILKIPAATASAVAKPATPSQTYIVQAGEYLAEIAMRFDTTVQAVALANNLPNNWMIYVGQRLTIPVGQTTNTTAAVPAASTTSVKTANVPLNKQEQTLTCEEASVEMATRGSVSEARLVAAMSRSDNPFVGIRGKTNSSYFGGLSDYGAYAQAIQKGLSALGVTSIVLYGQKYEDFKASILDHLGQGHPIVWWHTWRDSYQNPVAVKTSDGATVKLVPYEHAGVLVSATERGLSYHDPYDATVRFVTWEDHRRVSGYFDNMALVIP